MGLPGDAVGWSSGSSLISAAAAAESAFSASASGSGFTLHTARAESAVDLTGDLCGRHLDATAYFVVPGPSSGATAPEASQPALACEQLSQPDGTQLLRVIGPGAVADAELYHLEVVHPGGWVRVNPMYYSPDGQTRLQLTEEQLTEIVTDPALRW